LDRPAVRPALARHLQGALHALPSERAAVLLHLRAGGDRPRLLRGQRARPEADPRRLRLPAAGLQPEQLRVAVAPADRLLLRLLPGDHAPARPDGNAAGRAGVDLHARTVRRQRPAQGRPGPGRKERLSLMLRKPTVLAAFGLALAFTGLAFVAPALAETTQADLKPVHWSFDYPVFGKFDQEQLQRGYKVYHDVCSNCHSMNLMTFGDMAAKGGPFFNEKYPNPNDNPYVKALAAEYKIADVDRDTGDATTRPGETKDHFKAPFANEYAAAAANGGKAPPDMSLLAKAREGGLIGMPPPLRDDAVTYDDGVKATTDQEAKDVSAFLAWAAEPHADQRRQTGFAVMIYLLIFAGLLYASYKRIWRNIAH